MTTRTGIEVALGIAFLILAYFFFTQSGTLSDTELALEGVQASGTVLAENADSAGTEAALALSDAEDSANEASTEAAIQLNSSYTTGTESAELASENEAHIVATATQSALQAADDLSMMHATVTQNADILSAFQVDATEFSNNSATQQAELSANAEATASQLQVQLDDSIDVALTQDVQLNVASTTVYQQQIALTEIAQITESTQVTESASNNSGEPLSVEVPDDFVLFSHPDFEMYVPADFLVFNMETQQDEAIEVFSALGPEYEGMVQVAEGGIASGIIVGVSEKANADTTVDNLLVLVEQTGGDFSMEFYIESAVNFLPRAATINVQDVITVNEKEFGRIEYSLDIGGITAYQLIYIAKSGNDFYLVFYSTYGNLWEKRKPQFEASLASFRFLDD